VQANVGSELFDLVLFLNECKGTIVCATGQQYARGRAGRFLTTRWGVVLLSAPVAVQAAVTAMSTSEGDTDDNRRYRRTA